MKLKEEDVVLCIVKKIEGTTVFLEIDGNGEGSMTFSEVAPGRIRNIREFIVPNKKVVCKVLRVHDSHVELSLRRVTAGEREEALSHYTKENALKTILSSVIGDHFPEIIKKINEDYNLADFLTKVKENPAIIEKYVTKIEAETLKKVFAEKKDKEKEIKKIVRVKTLGESGLADIQHVLASKDTDIRYLGSSRFSISVKGKDFKKAKAKIDEIIHSMGERARQLKVEFRVVE